MGKTYPREELLLPTSFVYNFQETQMKEKHPEADMDLEEAALIEWARSVFEIAREALKEEIYFEKDRLGVNPTLDTNLQANAIAALQLLSGVHCSDASHAVEQVYQQALLQEQINVIKKKDET